MDYKACLIISCALVLLGVLVMQYRKFEALRVFLVLESNLHIDHKSDRVGYVYHDNFSELVEHVCRYIWLTPLLNRWTGQIIVVSNDDISAYRRETSALRKGWYYIPEGVSLSGRWIIGTITFRPSHGDGLGADPDLITVTIFPAESA